MNYIKHLTGVFMYIDNDNRLTPYHISLYMVLFRQWNLNRFKNPISITRDEVMKASKIGSANTYTKTLKELHKYQYIRYFPSYNPHIGSQVYLYSFDNSTDNGSVIAVRPSINIENNKKIKNKNTQAQAQKSENRIEKMKIKNITSEINSNDIPPSLEHLIIYFNEKEFPAVEAEKFFNYFQSNGWLVGGKTPMKDWKAAARNWMLNSKKFNSPNLNNVAKKQPTPGNLQTKTNKNYEEPL